MSTADLLDRTAREIVAECGAIADMLVAKNRRYGDSALQPLRLFSRADAVEQLAASLLAELTPPWSRWFGLAPGRALTGQDGLAAEAQAAAEALEQAADTLQGHLDRSSFALEMHQAFLDLVVAGTGVLLVEEAAPGEA